MVASFLADCASSARRAPTRRFLPRAAPDNQRDHDRCNSRQGAPTRVRATAAAALLARRRGAPGGVRTILAGIRRSDAARAPRAGVARRGVDRAVRCATCAAGAGVWRRHVPRADAAAAVMPFTALAVG